MHSIKAAGNKVQRRKELMKKTSVMTAAALLSLVLVSCGAAATGSGSYRKWQGSD